MADCSFARCQQQKRHVRRELQRWAKNMVYIVGLERIAEELMGRRKWKLCQEPVSRNYLQPLNNNNDEEDTTTGNSSVEKESRVEDGPHKQTLIDTKQLNNNFTNNCTTSNNQNPTLETAGTSLILNTTLSTTPKSTNPIISTSPNITGSVLNTSDSTLNLTGVTVSPSGTQTQTVNLNTVNTTNVTLNSSSILNPTSTTPNLTQTPPITAVPTTATTLNQSTTVNTAPNTTLNTTTSAQSGASLTTASQSLPTSTPAIFSGLKSNRTLSKEEEESLDWKPQKNCYFCVDGKLEGENAQQGALSPRHSDSENTSDTQSEPEALPTLTPAHHSHGRFTSNPSTTTSPFSPSIPLSKIPMATIENLALALAGSPSPQQLPFYPHLIPPAWYQLAQRTLQERSGGSGAEGPADKGEQPLDLSSKSSGSNGSTANNGASGNNVGSNGSGGNGSPSSLYADASKLLPGVRLPQLEAKHIFKAKPRMSAVAGRRTYTEDELQAALRDIQSGKLGTRRAAVIYGIPRSTLRNKVYKLSLEHKRETHLSTSVPLKVNDDEAMDEDKDLSGTEEEKEVERALEGPLLTIEDILRFSSLEPEGLRALLAKNRENEVWPGLEAGLRRHVEAEKKMNEDNPMLKKFSDEQMQRSNGEGEKSDAETEESASNVILKIPSYKPTTSKNGTEAFSSVISPPETNSPPISHLKPGLTTKDVKDVLAKNIKVRQSPEPLRLPTFMDIDFKRVDFAPLTANTLIKEAGPRVYPQPPSQPIVQQQQPPQQQQNQQQQNKPQQQQGGKGTRPKRGKYRNYDRDSLVEAVRAVQRGEMSVHRAGSYYGVPHSTLEYKVKERHLMRPRKRDPKPNPVDEKIASLKQSEMRQQQDKNKAVPKPPTKFAPTSPNGVKLPIFDAGLAPLAYNHPFPFWHPTFPHIPLEYSRTTAFPTNQEFFASQMMQKLQEQNATPAKSARQMESLLDAGGSNGFLDGIIRSSLESGVPNADDKNAKEDKNVAPENMSNKALLDQLCRNSRLTPLPLPRGQEDEVRSNGQAPPESDAASTSSAADKKEEERSTPAPRIYLKQELTNPENLKPEMLVRYRHDLDHRNGLEPTPDVQDMVQD